MFLESMRNVGNTCKCLDKPWRHSLGWLHVYSVQKYWNYLIDRYRDVDNENSMNNIVEELLESFSKKFLFTNFINISDKFKCDHSKFSWIRHQLSKFFKIVQNSLIFMKLLQNFWKFFNITENYPKFFTNFFKFFKLHKILQKL